MGDDELRSTYESLLSLSPAALELLDRRYIQKDADGNSSETPFELFLRVAKNIAAVEKIYEKNNFENRVEEYTDIFLKDLVEQNFVPASPILMHAGTNLQSLFSDYALDVLDSMEDIFDTLKLAAQIQQLGGGLGFNFSKIRPQYDDVAGMKDVAFGPVNVMEIFDTSFNAIMQGGRRPGANMAVLDVTHPDSMKFITIKKDLHKLQNFNLSVLITNEFMQAVKDDDSIQLKNPRNNEITSSVSARSILKEIATQAWLSGDPGIIFIDEMNATYPFKESDVLCTGPCGQYALENYEAVPYAHINLPKMLIDSPNQVQIDEEKLRRTVRDAVRFLDNCIDAHTYITKIIEENVKSSRKIGLGVLGFADMLNYMNIEYDSPQALAIIEIIMNIIKEESKKSSHLLAKERGVFPRYTQTTWDQEMRNATITSIAPTGSTSIIANTSASIEPTFNVATSISAKDHLKVVAAFQKHIDNSISKTINLSSTATIEDIIEIYMMAWELKCKGITIYRDGSRSDQLMSSSTLS